MSSFRSSNSFWQDNLSPRARFPKLVDPIKTDVLIIGAGITGLMTAYELKKKGASVVIIDKHHVGSGESSNTTAHLTCITDLRLSELVKNFGPDHACAIWDAGTAAIEKIHETIHQEKIDCSFSWVPGYFHASLNTPEDSSSFSHEAELARGMGFESTFVDSAPLIDRAGMCLERQAKFHPLKFLNAFADSIESLGRCIYEESEATYFSPSDNSVIVNGQVVTADTVVMATHVPLQGRLSTAEAALFQTKLYPYTSYVIRAELPDCMAAEGLYWDSSDPYYYLRLDIDGGKRFAIFGGLDSKTGQEDDADRKFENLLDKLRTIVPSAKVTERWAGQVVETNDGVPFIGQMDKRQFIATGYSGNGFTYGAVAAMLISDEISGKKNPWKDLFYPGRIKLKGGAFDYLKENVDYPYYMAKQYLLEKSLKGDPESLTAGEGAIFRVGEEKVAACRTKDGTLHSVSPKCTHMGCFVRWNSALESWDCPCHGSRFAACGAVLGGPAEKDLEKIEIQ